MIITIRNKHSGTEKDYEALFELSTDEKYINLTIMKKNGSLKVFYFEKSDYEIAYIG